MRLRSGHLHVDTTRRGFLTCTRSVIGFACPCTPLSSKYGEEENVVAADARTMFALVINVQHPRLFPLRTNLDFGRFGIESR